MKFHPHHHHHHHHHMGSNNINILKFPNKNSDNIASARDSVQEFVTINILLN